MTERGMIFNAEMVRAVLDGRKTQTRRIMTVQPDSPNFGLLRITDSTKRADIGKYHWAESNATGTHARSPLFSCPFGAVGDRLWVRENFFEHGHWEGGGYDPEESYFVSDKQLLYPADGVKRPGQRTRKDFWRSRPSIHMPRWASRITLEITGVRVERLQDISQADAIAEGGTPHFNVDWFSGLWAAIYDVESWQANPWVWVIEFKRVEGDKHA